MKRVFIAFQILKDGSIVPHDHPVFTGDVAYDLGAEQDVQVCDGLNVREFNGANELLTAVNDYNTQHPRQDKDNPYIPFGNFFIVERYTLNDRPIATQVAKTKRIPGVTYKPAPVKK